MISIIAFLVMYIYMLSTHPELSIYDPRSGTGEGGKAALKLAAREQRGRIEGASKEQGRQGVASREHRGAASEQKERAISLKEEHVLALLFRNASFSRPHPPYVCIYVYMFSGYYIATSSSYLFIYLDIFFTQPY